MLMMLMLVVFVMTSCELIMPSESENNDVSGDGNDTVDPETCAHSWSNYVTAYAPLCGSGEKAILRSTCKICSAVREKTASGYEQHSITEVVTDAVCCVDGKIERICINCEYYSEEIIPALVHKYKLMRLSESNDRCGFVCLLCGDLEKYVSVVSYEDFGAVGDGVTDDSEAIRAAHNAANEFGLPVRANAYATYYIGPISETIRIQTDTDWNGAHFIFDDHTIRWDDSKLRGVNVFTVTAESGSLSIEVPEDFKISKGQTNIGLTFDQPCMLKIVNSNEKIYIRYGVNANSGANKYELILVDENGNVDPSTPIQYDYTAVTELRAYSTTDTPIFVGNAYVKTIAPNPKAYDPDYENNYCYYKRGIAVNRSNTTIYNVYHSIVGEDMTVEIDRDGDGIIEKWGDDKSYGVPYSGFFLFSGCNNVVMTDCLVQGHQAYNFWEGTSRNEMGSYDITASDCIGLQLLNLQQYENQATGEVITNRFIYHGIMSSNFCRNIVMDNCYLDRFDAHQGLHNAKISNSTLGFGILVIGGGELYIENVYRITEGAFVLLRTDYNSVFDGDLIIKNCRMGPTITSVISGTWRSFYNGLPNYMFRSVTIDGLTVESSNREIYVYNVSSASKTSVNDSVNPLFLPDKIKVSGVAKVDGSSVNVKASNKSSDAFSTVPVTNN